MCGVCVHMIGQTSEPTPKLLQTHDIHPTTRNRERWVEKEGVKEKVQRERNVFAVADR